MSSKEDANSSDAENLCVLCFKNVDIYSIGNCDHPVCFECSTRMRVLCQQNECPICRTDMPKVLFSKYIELFNNLYPKFERSNLIDRKYGLIFCSSSIQNAYYKLLEHRCNICTDSERRWPFKTFDQLKDHMRKVHELFYCDICTENLKIFTSERRCYTRQELGLHRRKGDPDNTSHRGHPLCEFCDTRFMDMDELFRHLRRTHLFCHFCDADGRHLYYKSIEDLRKHFREEHYLCEVGECRSSPLTAAFRTEIDLKAHMAAEHSRQMGKSAIKQARTLELEFTLAPRNRNDGRNKRNNKNEEEAAAISYDEPGGGPGGGGQQDRVFVNPLTPQDFPALGNATNVVVQSRPTSLNFSTKSNKFSCDDFPSLGSGSRSTSAGVTISTSSTSRSTRTPEVTITRTVGGQPGGSRNLEDFPALGKQSSTASGESTLRLSVKSNQDPKAPKVSIQVNHKPSGAIHTHITTSAGNVQPTQQKFVEAFPALSESSKPHPIQPQWVQVKPKKQQESKASKVAPAPALPPSDLSQFPNLTKKDKKAKKSSVSVPISGDTAKKSSVSVPISGDWVNLNNYASNSRKKPEKATSPIREISQDDGKKKKKKGKNNGADIPNDLSVEDASKNELNKAKNGIVKKRSELTIDSLSDGDFSSVNTNFPNLGNGNSPLGTNNSSNFATSDSSSLVTSNFSNLGTCKPPPGFSRKPPPGFDSLSQNFPSLGYPNDLTFTTSSGASYSIKPANNYKMTSNFTTRNQNLIKRFMSLVNNNEAVGEFKNYSDMFRNGKMSADSYVEYCRSVLRLNFDDCFPELLVLLPDIEKQQELYKAYGGKNKKNLVVCENCQQVVFKKELTEHYNYHSLDNNFPSLGTATQVNNSWRK